MNWQYVKGCYGNANSVDPDQEQSDLGQANMSTYLGSIW